MKNGQSDNEEKTKKITIYFRQWAMSYGQCAMKTNNGCLYLNNK